MTVITYTYPESPYAYKAQAILSLYGIEYKNVRVPRVLPRPELELIGLNYRRIPVIAVDGDVYCDSAAITAYAETAGKAPPLPQGAPVLAMKILGDNIFKAALMTIPPQALTEAWIKDRKPLFALLGEEAFLKGEMRNPGLAELRSLLLQLQESIQGDWLCGSPHVTLLDANVAWVIRWVLSMIGVGKEDGFKKEDMPQLWAWMERFVQAVKIEPEQISAEEAAKIVLAGKKATVSQEETKYEKTDFKAGDSVSITQAGVEPTHPVKGTLLSLSVDEIVVKIDSGIHVHFPRIGQQIAHT